MNVNNRMDRVLIVLGRTLYVLAVIALGIGIYCVIGIANFAASVSGLLPLLGAAMGNNPLVNLLSGSVSSSLNLIGVLLLLGALAISVLLFASGKLLIRSQALSQRVARLEALTAAPSQHGARATAGREQSTM